MSESGDLLMNFLRDNPPQDALELREMLDTFMIQMGNADLPGIGASHDDIVIDSGGGRELTVDVHVPNGTGPFPLLVYLHGGGWILGSPKTHRRLGFRFAEAGYLVFNVHYRLAPEHPFPAAFDDCVTAIRWAAAHAAEYGGDASRLAAGGDSAGGNLAAAAVAALRNEIDIGALLLIYAALDLGAMDAAVEIMPGGGDLMEMMVGSYLGTERAQLERDPRVSPIHAAEALPPTHILCGTMDPLLDDARALAAKLERAAIPHEFVVYEDMPHGFVQMEEVFDDARRAIDAMVTFLDVRFA
jgi:acetyl esterase/lipase